MGGFSKSRIQRIVVNNAIQAQQASSATSAVSATSASYALTASFAMNGGGGGGTTTGSFTGSFTGSLLGTASQALTSSYLQGSVTSASYATSAGTTSTITVNVFGSPVESYLLMSNVAGLPGVAIGGDADLRYNTSTNVLTVGNVSATTLTGSLLGTASYTTQALSSSYSLSSSYALNSTSASIAQTASFYGGNVTSASYAISSSFSEVSNKINVINGSTSSAEYYPVIVDDLGNMIPYLDVNFSYTPSTNQLNVGGITSSLFGTSSWANNAITASYVLQAVSSSFASTSSFVNTLNQNVLITGSLTIGSSSVGIGENTLTVGPAPNGGVGEGGQILLQAPNSGGFTSASMIDNYQNQFRLLRGTNAGSDAIVAAWDMHTKQMQIPQYNSATAFSGTAIAALNTDANGFIIPTAATLNHQIAAQQAAGSVLKGYNIGCPLPSLATGGQALSGGVGTYIAIYIHTTTLITGVKFQQQTQGVYTAANYNGVGLYSVSAGTLNLVASSSNDGNIWKGANNSFQTKAFTSTYSAAPGLYYICALYSTSAPTTNPAIAFGGSAAAGTAALGVLDFINNNKMNGTAGSGLTTLATSQAASGITATQHRYAFYLY